MIGLSTRKTALRNDVDRRVYRAAMAEFWAGNETGLKDCGLVPPGSAEAADKWKLHGRQNWQLAQHNVCKSAV